MPPELPNEQELILKKRARRRLVGAIALVLLMVIILPMILKDRTAPDAQDAIKINMPETKSDDFNSTVIPVGGNAGTPKPEEGAAVADAPADEVVEPSKPESTAKAPEVNGTSEKPSPAKATNKPIETVKPVEIVKPTESKKTEVTKAPMAKVPEVAKAPEATAAKSTESFIVQIGVFSDAANVKQLQDKLKQAGYTSHTEKISTPKGEKIRLRTNSFKSRLEADAALSKIKQAGLSGLVMPNT